MTIHLRSVALNTIRARGPQDNEFPFSVPIIKHLTEIQFSTPVTFLVGENGSGKSTFLEGIAAASNAISVGSEEMATDRTLNKIRALAKALKLTWTAKKHTGFFLRSEDFFGYVKRLSAMRAEILSELERVEQEYKDRPEALPYARMPHARELHEMQRRYGEDLDAFSHGESYFQLFKARFVPNGLYLLDEPEAPLSPMRQIIFLSLIKMMVDQNGQFIIATHSPILLAYPGATILSFDGGSITPVEFDRLEHVNVTRSFLNNPARYIDPLFANLDSAE